MADIYADATTGGDLAGRGTLAEPFRSITFGISEAVRLYGSELTTIHVGPGTYNRAGGETFPILVPQNISLSGSGADRTNIDFERSVGDLNYYCIQAGGNEVSGLAIHGRPRNPDECGAIVGLSLREDGTHIQDIAVGAAPDVPPGEIGFDVGIFIWGVSATIERISVSRCGCGVEVIGHEGPVIGDSNFDDNGVGIRDWGSAAVIRNNDFAAGNDYGVGILKLSSTLVDGNRFHSPFRAGVVVDWTSGPRGPERPTIAGNGFEVEGYSCGVLSPRGEFVLEHNHFQLGSWGTAVYLGGGIRIPGDDPASPVIRNNDITKNVMDVTASRAPVPLIRIGGKSSPVVQENSFAFEGGGWGPVLTIEHDARPDLGGGPLGSTGENQFHGCIEIRVDTESLPGVIFARNNHWRRVPPHRGADVYSPREYYQSPSEPLVFVITSGAMPL